MGVHVSGASLVSDKEAKAIKFHLPGVGFRKK